jgi:hypothetical protein
MPKTVAYIHTYPGCAPILAMLWSGFKNLNLPIIGVDCVGEPTEYPEPVKTIEAGRNAYATDDPVNLPVRLILTLKHFLTTHYERCVIMEYDTLITGPLPDWPLHPYRMITKRAGGKHDSSEASQFFHTPWIFDRSSAGVVIGVGTQLVADPVMDRGGRGVHASPDMFLGLIMDRASFCWEDTGDTTFSRNTIDTPEQIAAARDAKARGCVFFHGVKTREQMEAILA